MDDRDRIELTKVASLGLRLPAIALIVVVAVAVAVAKPWAGGSTRTAPGGDGSPLASSTDLVPSASMASRPIAPTPSVDARSIPCLTGPTSWRAVTVERSADRETRSWIAIRPVPATGPSDPGIPQVTVVAGSLRGLGLCAPGEPPAERVPRLWRVPVPGRAGTTRVVPLRPLVPAAAGHADVYAPPDGLVAWPAGRYVFEVTMDRITRGPALAPAWFAVLVVDAPSGRETVPRPAPSPSTRP